MPRVLVTGLSGFIGRHIASVLLEHDWEVHGIGRGPRPSELHERATWRRINLFDLEATSKCVRELVPTHCLNLAWHIEHQKFWESPHNLSCVQASLNLLAAFVESGGRRFVGAGSCAEYDWSYGFLSEMTTPRIPNTAFGRCKNAVFEATMAHASVSGISAGWGRIFFVYGPFEIESRVVPHVITSLLAGRPARTSHGEQVRDFSYVSDIAAGLVALLESEVQGGVNIASGRPVAVKEIVEMIGRYVGRSDLIELGAIQPQQGEPPLLVADVRRLHDEVRFRSKWDLETGLTATIDHYRSGGRSKMNKHRSI
jgi:nucleoside-diphosphate-sugar epimerase